MQLKLSQTRHFIIETMKQIKCISLNTHQPHLKRIFANSSRKKELMMHLPHMGGADMV